jgi:hypothetical protein
MTSEPCDEPRQPETHRFLPIALATGGALFLGWLAGRYVYQREVITAAKQATDEHRDVLVLPGMVW